MDEAPRRSSGLTALLALLAVGGSAVGVVFYQMRQGREKPALDTSGFDIAQAVERTMAPSAQAPAPSAVGGGGAERMMVSRGGLALGQGQAQKSVSAADREREMQAMIRLHPVLRQYQKKLREIVARHWQKYPVVREIDAEFGKLGRFVALRRRYERDKDAHQFAREALALPEVRALVKRYLANGQAWRATLSMINEAIKAPPPKPLMDEMKHFFTHDEAVMEYTAKFGQDVSANAGVLAQNIPPEADMDAIMKLTRDLTPKSSMPSLNLPEGQQPRW